MRRPLKTIFAFLRCLLIVIPVLLMKTTWLLASISRCTSEYMKTFAHPTGNMGELSR